MFLPLNQYPKCFRSRSNGKRRTRVCLCSNIIHLSSDDGPTPPTDHGEINHTSTVNRNDDGRLVALVRSHRSRLRRLRIAGRVSGAGRK